MTNADFILNWIQNWAGIISSLGSLALSSFLVILYRQQRDILNEQKDLTESTQKAVVRVESIDFIQGTDMAHVLSEIDGEFEPWRVHLDYFPIVLSNFGKSPAFDLELELKMYFGDSGSHQLFRTFLSRSISVSNQMAFNNDSDVIGSGEKDMEFLAQMYAEKDKIPSEWASVHEDAPDDLAPSEVMFLASEAGEEKLKVDISLRYSDFTGERKPKKLHSVKFDPQEFQDLGSAIKQGEYLFEE